MVLRTVPPWRQELGKELEEVVEDHARKNDIDFKFLNDAKEISEGINQICSAMERLKTDVKDHDERRVLREHSEELQKTREQTTQLKEEMKENYEEKNDG